MEKSVNENSQHEIGDDAVWTLSTAKSGNGVEQLRDDNIDTFWQYGDLELIDTFVQSDGPQPHTISIQFHQKMLLKELCFYTDYKLDESYTPAKISVRVGTNLMDLQEVSSLDLEEPTGWISIPLTISNAEYELLSAFNKPVNSFSISSQTTSCRSDVDSSMTCMRASFVQLCILSSQQNGRDTHVRQVRIFGHRPKVTKPHPVDLSQFSSIEFQSMSTIR